MSRKQQQPREAKPDMVEFEVINREICLDVADTISPDDAGMSETQH